MERPLSAALSSPSMAKRGKLCWFEDWASRIRRIEVCGVRLPKPFRFRTNDFGDGEPKALTVDFSSVK
jgi:hypothetical protein